MPLPPAVRRALRLDDAWWPRPALNAAGEHRHTVGARPVDAGSWLRPRPHDEALVEWKDRRLAELGPRAFRGGPDTVEAGRAVLDLLGRRPHDVKHPLDLAARYVAEDLCLVDVTGPEPVLVAGSVVMPSGWLIGDKVGRPMLAVHEPVPQYAEQIGTASDQLLRKLTADRIVARVNWTMQAGDALFRPPGDPQPPVSGPAEAADVVHLRVEYQTLRRVTDAHVLFTIRTALEPLTALADRPALLATTRDALANLPPDQRVYKGMQTFAEPALTWLCDAALR
ncbi:heme-dependent oxidative N-demethylase family protein [Spongisporangium articulatum]|uniref:Heme-dependent oxidative N-demethylase family protein n=1 Tax=Spongisporangium articulatum TaxID=3362603 RepID=A0ABW8APC2_9ACTN